MDSQTTCIITIDHLKREIQYLIDKKKGMKGDNSELEILEREKKEKMSELKKTTERLKELVKLEKQEMKRQKELKMVSKKVDTLAFAGARQSKSQYAMEKATQAQDLREKSALEYNEYLKYEVEYKKKDSELYPGCLFLHTKIVSEYGVCPFIRIDVEEDVKASVEEDRKSWLESTSDKGKLYYELYDTLINKVELQSIEVSKNDKEKRLDDYICTVLSSSQYKLWQECEKFAKEYIRCAIKTKTIKNRFKILINDLSTLRAETLLQLEEYLSIKYNFYFMANDVKTEDGDEEGEVKLYKKVCKEHFEGVLKEYKQILEEKEIKTKYVNNINRNLTNELYKYLTEKKIFQQVNVNSNQIGKYYKRWTLLSNEEQMERFVSFANHHIEKYMIQENILKKEQKDEVVEGLVKLLLEGYKKKDFVYKDFKWVTKKGVIEYVSCLKYSKDENKFYITKQSPGKAVHQKKRKTSNRTLFTKENEKLINEEILQFVVLKLMDKAESVVDKSDKEICVENIKAKLKIKKINTVDKGIIYKKYDEMFSIVRNNESSYSEVIVKL